MVERIGEVAIMQRKEEKTGTGPAVLNQLLSIIFPHAVHISPHAVHISPHLFGNQFADGFTTPHLGKCSTNPAVFGLYLGPPTGPCQLAKALYSFSLWKAV